MAEAFAVDGKAVVKDHDLQHIADARGIDQDSAAAALFFQTVLDGIFHEGLQQQFGDIQPQVAVGHLDAQLDLALGADGHDVAVLL